MECGKTRNYCFRAIASKNNIKFKKYYAEIQQKNGIEIQSQHWDGNRKLSMEGIAVEYFPNLFDPGNNKEIFNSIHI